MEVALHLIISEDIIVVIALVVSTRIIRMEMHTHTPAEWTYTLSVCCSGFEENSMEIVWHWRGFIGAIMYLTAVSNDFKV